MLKPPVLVVVSAFNWQSFAGCESTLPMRTPTLARCNACQINRDPFHRGFKTLFVITDLALFLLTLFQALGKFQFFQVNIEALFFRCQLAGRSPSTTPMSVQRQVLSTLLHLFDFC